MFYTAEGTNLQWGQSLTQPSWTLHYQEPRALPMTPYHGWSAPRFIWDTAVYSITVSVQLTEVGPGSLHRSGIRVAGQKDWEIMLELR